MSVGKMRILIVDDERDILELMADEFKFYGHEIEVAVSGNEAIEKLKLFQFDVIVSDYRMPNGNGMTLLNYVNTLVIKPIFFFFSGQSDASIEECLFNGAKHFFTKPFNLNELIDQINALVEIKKSNV